jgi:hypothetical protein
MEDGIMIVSSDSAALPPPAMSAAEPAPLLTIAVTATRMYRVRVQSCPSVRRKPFSHKLLISGVNGHHSSVQNWMLSHFKKLHMVRLDSGKQTILFLFFPLKS